MSLYDRVDRGRRRRRIVVVGVLLLVALGGVAAWWLLRPVPEDPAVAARALAEAWSGGGFAGAPFGEDAPTDLAERYEAVTSGLDADPPEVEVVAVSDPASTSDPLSATADLAVTWVLPGDHTWEYDTTAPLARQDGELTWHVVWEPSLVHPRLDGDLVLARRRTTPPRAEVQAADGRPIVTQREVVDVGIEPRRVEDLQQLVADIGDTLQDALDVRIDRQGLVQRVRDADDTEFVPVVTLRSGDYFGSVRQAIRPLPGTVFREPREVPLAPTSDFARFTLGSAGPVTAEMLEEDPGRYERGDLAGRSGLQAAHDQRLFGTPGVQVRLSGDPAPSDPVLFAEEPVPGEPVRVTLDPAVQRAADTAVDGTGRATAMAVVRPSDGHVLALANSSEATFDIARTGQVPPGSTFKVVTTAALLAETELGLDTTVDCPSSFTVDGREITNAEDQELGPVPFRTAFVNSCNTAFVQLSRDLGPDSLRQAAARFGLGRELGIGLPAFGGRVPATDGPVALAEGAIGQGQDLASPLAMASAMATVAEGRYRAPRLVLEPEPGGGGPVPDPLPPVLAEILRELTRGVVTEGTGTALRGAPGGAVHGKTGTAEFQAEDGTIRTHAWFVGFRGDLAFAVAVTDTPGEYGGEVAAPVAQRFLDAVAEP